MGGGENGTGSSEVRSSMYVLVGVLIGVLGGGLRPCIRRGSFLSREKWRMVAFGTCIVQS